MKVPEEDMFQIVVAFPQHRDWICGLLDDAGLELFKMPIEDETPTYGIGFKHD